MPNFLRRFLIWILTPRLDRDIKRDCPVCGGRCRPE